MARCDIEGAVKRIEELYKTIPSDKENNQARRALKELSLRIGGSRSTIHQANSFAGHSTITSGSVVESYLVKPDYQQQTPIESFAPVGQVKEVTFSSFINNIMGIADQVDTSRNLKQKSVMTEKFLHTVGQTIKIYGKNRKLKVRLVPKAVDRTTGKEHLSIYRKDEGVLDIAIEPEIDGSLVESLLPTQKVILQELVKSVAAEALPNAGKLASDISALRTHVSTQVSRINNLDSDEAFIAEVLTSPSLQRALHRKSPLYAKNVRDKVKKIFKKLLGFIKTRAKVSGPTLLEESLDVIDQVLSGDGFKEPTSNDNSDTPLDTLDLMSKQDLLKMVPHKTEEQSNPVVEKRSEGKGTLDMFKDVDTAEANDIINKINQCKKD